MAQPIYTLIGTYFSTFTRSIALGLQYKGVNYTQKAVLPHTPLARENHPFGYIPTLVIHEIEGKPVNVKLRESQAIVRYLDRVVPEPSLQLKPGDAIIEEKLWEFVSFVTSFGFPTVEGSLVKPRIYMQYQGVFSSQRIRAAIAEGLSETKEFISIAESLMSDEGPYVFGKQLTWADFFLFPIVSDLRIIPEWEEVATKKLEKWAKNMDQLEAVKATIEGTLSQRARR